MVVDEETRKQKIFKKKKIIRAKILLRGNEKEMHE